MVVGLTGSMGCGKSTAAGFFEEAGFRSVDTDHVVHELLANNLFVITAIRRQFGNGVMNDRGAVDRKALGHVVFSDSAGLAWLEKLLHPLVAEHWQSLVTGTPGRDWVVQIPLLFEKKLEETVDFAVCIGADVVTQQKRLHQRGLTGPEISRRLAKQMPLQIKMERAGFFLLNNGSLEFLRKQVRNLIDLFNARPPAKS